MKYIIRSSFEDNGIFIKPFDSMVLDKDKTILIEISSPGGDLDTALEAFAKVHECKQQGKKIVTYVTGRACSAGSFLMWMGDEIYLSPSSYVMFHKIQVSYDSAWSHAKQLWRDFKGKYFYKTRDEIALCNGILDAYAPWEEIMKSHKKADMLGDFYFTAHEIADMFPYKVKIGAPPYKLELWDEEWEYCPDVVETVKEVEEEEVVEEEEEEATENEVWENDSEES